MKYDDHKCKCLLKTLDFQEWRTADRVLHVSAAGSLGVKKKKQSVSFVWIVGEFWPIILGIVR